jgi:hypothetical protein
MIGTKSTEDVLCGHLELIGELGAVPRKGVYDGEPAISLRRRGQVIYTAVAGRARFRLTRRSSSGGMGAKGAGQVVIDVRAGRDAMPELERRWRARQGVCPAS